MLGSIVNLANKYHMLEILCLDHCEMLDADCNQLFPNMTNSNLEFLNISWNRLSGDSMSAVV